MIVITILKYTNDIVSITNVNNTDNHNNDKENNNNRAYGTLVLIIILYNK